MKHFRYFTINLVLAFFIYSCSTTKKVNAQAQMEALDSVIQNRHFTIESNWANPQVSNAMQQVLNSNLMPLGSGSGSISLVGNYNYLTISGDSITTHLPYFGERHMNVVYGGGDNVIQLKGLMKDCKVTKRKDNSYLIDFTLKNKSHSENFTVSISLFPNFQSDIFISSSSRFPIRYQGEIIKKVITK